MDTVTRLQPLSPARAQELLGLMRDVQHEETRALLLDGDGRVEGIVGVDDPQAEHLLGDLDVHA
jgi:hypothetical protein